MPEEESYEGVTARTPQEGNDPSTNTQPTQDTGSSDESKDDWHDLAIPDYSEEASGSGESEEEAPSEEEKTPDEGSQHEGETPAEGDEDTEAAAEEKEEPSVEEKEESSKEEEEKPSEEEETYEQRQERLKESRNQARTELEERFKLSDDQVDKLLENPNEVLPSLAADLYLDVYEQAITAVMSQLPNVVQQINQQEQTRSKNEQDFYKQWPQLDDSKYKDTVDRIATVYRQNNPQADRETFIREVGAQAAVALRLPIEGEKSSSTEVVEEEAPAPTRPAKPGAGGPGPREGAPGHGPKNEFEEMYEEDYGS